MEALDTYLDYSTHFNLYFSNLNLNEKKSDDRGFARPNFPPSPPPPSPIPGILVVQPISYIIVLHSTYPGSATVRMYDSTMDSVRL